MPVVNTLIAHHELCNDRASPKRKLEDCFSSGDAGDQDDWVSPPRMRRFEEVTADKNQTQNPSFGYSFRSDEAPDSRDKDVGDLPFPQPSSLNFLRGESSPSSSSSSQVIHFFVNIDGKSLNCHENSGDTVLMLHQKLVSVTGISIGDQRLLYQGRQLQWDETLRDCLIGKDSTVFLVARMRSSVHPLACQLADDLVSSILRICRNDAHPSAIELVRLRQKLNEYIAGIPGRYFDHFDLFRDQLRCAAELSPCNIAKIVAAAGARMAAQFDISAQSAHIPDVTGYLQVFMDFDAPKALVAMYRSKAQTAQKCAYDCIYGFITVVQTLGRRGYNEAFSATVLVEFCKLLFPGNISGDHPLYLKCRSFLASMVKAVGLAGGPERVDKSKHLLGVQDIFPFLNEVVTKLESGLVSSLATDGSKGPECTDVSDLSAFMSPLICLIRHENMWNIPVSVPNHKGKSVAGPSLNARELVFDCFTRLLQAMVQCLEKMEELMLAGTFSVGWSQYLAILKELHIIAKTYQGVEDQFWSIMRCRMVSFNALVVRYARREENHSWLLKQKNSLDFDSRRHLALLMFPEAKEDYEELHEMLIDRSQLLAESYEYILNTEPSMLHAGLFMEFKNEEATGPGVLREWFVLVCQAILNPEQALFVTSPQDRDRIFPNPVSKVDLLHLQYFRFSGRIIALALMHKVQVGATLDRVFFLQLAGDKISLESIKDTDPYMYRSCKQILEMDEEFINSDALGLTFARDIEELGSRKTVELCPGGMHKAVTSKNRNMYVNLLIEHCFVTSIKEQVCHFAQGFADILACNSLTEHFFKGLYLEDIDAMLRGTGSGIGFEDWKKHTEYNGFKMSDPQVSWFWEVVEEMCEEQRRNLLHFWTSVKYLPIEGFRGLASRLYIYRVMEPPNHLPTSHTCFFRLCLPAYPSRSVMKNCLAVITQQHFGSSFGNW